jgi:hypothetical protein
MGQEERRTGGTIESNQSKKYWKEIHLDTQRIDSALEKPIHQFLIIYPHHYTPRKH